MKNSTFAQRLRAGLDVRQMTQAELSQRSKISKSSISHYLKGDWEGKQDAVYSLAQVLDVSEAWLMGYDVPMEADRPTATTAAPIPPGFAVPGDKTPLPAGATAMNPHQVAPLLGTVRAGLPMYAEENIVDYIPIRQTDGASYFWLTVRGDSMNAAGMEDGDQILVRTQPEVENGEIAVVMVNGDEATVKQFRQEGDLVILTPRSLNPVHQPQIYDLKKTPVRVLGRLVECRKVY